MRFQKPLDTILSSGVKVRILRFLCRKGGQWNGRRIAAQLGISPVTAHRALRELREDTVLDFQKVGNNFVYSLRDEHYLVREVLRPLFELEANSLSRMTDFLSRCIEGKLKTQVVSVVLYGSVARGQEGPSSDIDLMVLVKSEGAKGEVRRVLDDLWGAVASRFGNPAAFYVNTVQEARGKLRHRLSVLESIMQHHRLVWGRPLKEILHARTA